MTRGNLIIVEGADGTGKSTLIKRIANKDSQYHRLVMPRCDNITDPIEYYNAVIAELETIPAGESVITDRSWISDVVYAPLTGRVSRVTPEFLALLYPYLESRYENIMVLLCEVSRNAVIRNIEERGDTYVTIEQILAAMDTYRAIFNAENKLRFGVPDLMVRYDYSTTSPASCMRFVDRKWNFPGGNQ